MRTNYAFDEIVETFSAYADHRDISWRQEQVGAANMRMHCDF